MKTSNLSHQQGLFGESRQSRPFFYGQGVGIKSKRNFDGWLVLLLIGAILEGVFYSKLTTLVVERKYFIFQLTPYYLYPTDLILLPLSLILVFFTSTYKGTRIKERRGLLLTWLALCCLGATIGKLNNNSNLLSDIRNYIIHPIIAITIYRIGLQSNMKKVMDKVVSFGIIIALISIFTRILSLNGINSNIGTLTDWGMIGLFFPYCYLFVEYLTKKKQSVWILFKLLILAVGILQGFWKPVVLGFIFLNLFTLILIRTLMVRYRNIIPKKRLFGGISVIVGIAVAFGLLYLIGFQTYNALFQQKYLKIGSVAPDITGGRLKIWANAIDMWRKHPVFGTGFGKLLSGYVFDSGTGIWNYLNQYWAHSITLGFLYMTGSVGIFIMAIIIFRWIKLVLKTTRLIPIECLPQYISTFIFCVSVFFIAQYDEVLSQSSVSFLFWSVLGLEAVYASRLFLTDIKQEGK